MSLRVVIVTRIPPVLAGFDAVIREAGHKPVAFLTMRNTDGRYGPISQTVLHVPCRSASSSMALTVSGVVPGSAKVRSM